MYRKIVNNGYIIYITEQECDFGTPISEEEFLAILNAVETKPEPQEGFGYKLKEDLTWELFNLPKINEEPQE